MRAGVSTATVSYILSGRRDRANPVSDATRRRVLQAARDLGYRRNHAARSLRRRRTDVVCVIHRPPSSPWLDRLTAQLSEAAQRHGYSVITMPVEPGEPARHAVRLLSEQYVDGAIITPGCGLPHDELVILARHGLALVTYDDDAPPDGLDVVRQSRAPACDAAVEHLVQRGHRRIAYLGHGDPAGPPDADVTSLSYRRVLAAHGIPVDESLMLAAADQRTAAHRATVALLRRGDRPTAVFAATDRAGIAALWAARQLGVEVPDGLAVAGVGNTDEAAAISPALTSVGIPGFDFAAPVDRLFQRLAAPRRLPGAELPQPWRLFAREST